jgi:glycerophosphoryl diester phosphodiesterase
VPVTRRTDLTWPYLDTPVPFVLAHRGFSPDGLENTMVAFEAAVRLGVRYLETDVHATRDDRLVAFHDPRLDRVTDRTGLVRELDWVQVERARIAGREPVPLLEDVLGAWPDVRINIDVKAAGAIQPLAEVIRRTRCQDRVLVGSFSDRRRRAVLQLLPEPRPAFSLGVGSTAGVVLASLLGRGGLGRSAVTRAFGGAACLQVPPSSNGIPVISRRLLDAVHTAGGQVHVWTIDDPAQMATLLDLGVDALVTNRADLAVELLRQRAGPR